MMPRLPDIDNSASSADVPPIRIHSDIKWPERVVFDTSQPVVPLPKPALAEAAPAPPSVSAEFPPKARVREAFAQLPLSAQVPAETKKPAVVKPKHKVARVRVPRQPGMFMPQQPMLVAQQPHFGFFNTW
jgi:hypothetical protein